MSDNIVNDLIAQLRTKQAGEEAPTKKEGEPDKDEKDSAGKGDESKKDESDGKPPWLAGKTAAEVLAALTETLPEPVKVAMEVDAAVQLLADQAQRELIFGTAQAKEAAVVSEMPQERQREIFNGCFDDELAKFAAGDPHFARALRYLATRAAFEEGYAQEKGSAA